MEDYTVEKPLNDETSLQTARKSMQPTATMAMRDALKAKSEAEVIASGVNYGYRGGVSPEALPGYQCGI